jgi:hypothetical protein
MRTFEEAVKLPERISANFREVGNEAAGEEFYKKAQESRRISKIMHKKVMTWELISEDWAEVKKAIA